MSTVAIGTEALERQPFMTDPEVRIMERLRDGEMDAMAELVDRYQGELVGYFYHRCWDQMQAEDLAQTVFLKVFKARERYKVTAKLRTWIYRIAHNAWVDHLRRRRPAVSLDAERGENGGALKDILAAEDEEEHEDRDDLIRERIRSAVSELPQGQQDVFILANNQDMKYQEIGHVLGIPEGTVKSRMHAAVRALRTQLRDLIEE